MTLDVQSLRDDVHRLVEQAAKIQRTIDEAAKDEAVPAAVGEVTSALPSQLKLPPEIVVPDPAAVASYLTNHEDLVGIVHDLAVALVAEFRGERSEIELILYRDPEIDDRYLTYYVRASAYDETLMPRLHAVSEQVDGRFRDTDDFVLVTTDHRPIE